MERVTAEDIAAFTQITGVSEPLARLRLEEHRGNLDEAIHAHFAEAEGNAYPMSHLPAERYGYGYGSNQEMGGRGPLQLPSAFRSFWPSLLLDPHYWRNLYGRIGSEVYNNDYRRQQQQFDQSIYDGYAVPSSRPRENFVVDGFPSLDHSLNEEEMMRRAIESSKQEYMSRVRQIEDNDEIDELSRVVALSLKTAEEENQAREMVQEVEARPSRAAGDFEKNIDNTKPGLSSLEHHITPIHRESAKDGENLTSGFQDETENHERLLADKEASLPPEPSVDDANVTNLIVRMPDGSRQGRRFYRHQKLQNLFDFIDVGRAVGPGSYRVVRQYPRRVYGMDDVTSSFEDLGLNSKHEVLFLELS